MFIHDGLRNGFRIDIIGPHDTSIAHNLGSSVSVPSVISEYLSNKNSHGHTAGHMVPSLAIPFTQQARKSGGHQLIVHLSAPHSWSVNYGIATDQYRLQYVKADYI